VPKLVLRFLVLAFFFSGIQALCQDAQAPIYSEIIPTSSGLVYNPVTDIQESFQAPNGKTVKVLVKGPQGSGTYTRTIQPGETPDAYFPAVVAEAVAAGAHHLVIPKAVYAFRGPKLCTDLQSSPCNSPTACNANEYWNCQPHWVIGQYPQGQVIVPNSISDLDIDFSGSELDFRAPIQGINILEAQRLRFRNLTVDWPHLPIASLGTITPDPLNPGHNALVIDSKYPAMDQYQGGPVQIQAVDIWDDEVDPPGTFDPKANNDFETYFIFGGVQPTYVGKTAVGDQTFSCESCTFQNSPTDPTCSMFQGCANFDLFAPGTRVIVRHYTYNGQAISVNWSNDIDFENVTLRTGPGMGITVSLNGGYRGLRLANSKITRGPGRIISTASDAINIGMKADLILEGNDVGFQGDDSVNIYSTTAAITAVHGDKIDVAGACDPDPMDTPVRGDMLAFFNPSYVYRDTARVIASTGPGCGTMTLTLDHAVARLSSSDNLLDLTQQPAARYIVRDNVFHECRCHGVVVNAPYGLIDTNLMFNNSAGGIELQGGSGAGPAATNLAITNNVISRPGQWTQTIGAISMIGVGADGNILSTPVFQKLRIANNLIEDAPGPAILATSTGYFEFGSNSIIDSNQIKSSPATFGTLPTLDSILVYESSDGVVCGTEMAGKTTGPIGIDPTDRRVPVTPNCP
jgi:hypothetical protein